MSRLRATIPTQAPDPQTIAYGVVAQRAFANLRALIGQLSGLLILAQAKLGRDVAGLPDVAIARERWHEAMEALGGLMPPAGRENDRAALAQAAAHIDAALTAIADIRRGREGTTVDAASAHLRAAYRQMQGLCDHRIGLGMVDMTEACAACGKVFNARP
jgi:hypothetical protein